MHRSPAIGGLFFLARSNSTEAKPREPEPKPTKAKPNSARGSIKPRDKGPETTSAAEMARAAGLDPKAFRQTLRDENLPWHTHNDPWIVSVGSPEHEDMQRVLARLVR